MPLCLCGTFLPTEGWTRSEGRWIYPSARIRSPSSTLASCPSGSSRVRSGTGVGSAARMPGNEPDSTPRCAERTHCSSGRETNPPSRVPRAERTHCSCGGERRQLRNEPTERVGRGERTQCRVGRETNPPNLVSRAERTHCSRGGERCQLRNEPTERIGCGERTHCAVGGAKRTHGGLGGLARRGADRWGRPRPRTHVPPDPGLTDRPGRSPDHLRACRQNPRRVPNLIATGARVSLFCVPVRRRAGHRPGDRFDPKPIQG